MHSNVTTDTNARTPRRYSTVTLPIDLTLSGLRNVKPVYYSDSPQWTTINLHFSNFDRSIRKNQDDDTSTMVLLKGLYLNKSKNNKNKSSGSTFVQSDSYRDAMSLNACWDLTLLSELRDLTMKSDYLAVVYVDIQMCWREK